MRKAILLVGMAAALAACNPFGLPSTRSLESGAEGMLTSAKSYEMKGTYQAGGVGWTIDVQVTRPDREHIIASSKGQQLEAVVLGDVAYFRGSKFLAAHMSDPRSQSLIAAAGDAWWKGIAVSLPTFPDLTNGPPFKSTFLGQSVTNRIDGQSVNGVPAVELSGARADVYIGTDSPNPLLRVRLKDGVTVDGITNADFTFGNVDAEFGIHDPAPVIDFSNLSTLPPIYTVMTVVTSGCASPCVVSATVKNLGGASGAIAPSTVTFTMSDPVTNRTLGTCTATVQPDVGYNDTTSVSCTINAQPVNAAVVTAVATNPGRGTTGNSTTS